VRPRPSFVVIALVSSLLVYAGIAVARHWWPSALMAPLLAVLLWRRHRRARFSAYVFFSVLARAARSPGCGRCPSMRSPSSACCRRRRRARRGRD